MVSSRIPAESIAAVDDWAAKNGITRSQAIARLVELGLTVKSGGRPKSEDVKQQPGRTKERARELAGSAIDEMTDTTASANDQGNRKRRLIQGPEEFQRMRRDRTKPK